ncbi:MAG: DUF881 domain-containing protein [Selenomonadaceae bacterium]|nr:DUF881 domain-containing protein [Selenomonadaceae bacterium]
MPSLKKGSWSIAGVCVVLGFMLAVQFRTTEEMRLPDGDISWQRMEELTDRLRALEEERDSLKEALRVAGEEGNASPRDEQLKILAGRTALIGPGVTIRLDDSNQKVKVGENPNLYVIHDDDLLKVINELRAAGAEAIAVNNERLTATSEIRCAGPTLSVNNVRSAAPFEIKAIGNRQTLEGALKMRGGVADSLKIWGIELSIDSAEEIYIPPYKGSGKFTYAVATEEKEGGA